MTIQEYKTFKENLSAFFNPIEKEEKNANLITKYYKVNNVWLKEVLNVDGKRLSITEEEPKFLHEITSIEKIEAQKKKSTLTEGETE